MGLILKVPSKSLDLGTVDEKFSALSLNVPFFVISVHRKNNIPRFDYLIEITEMKNKKIETKSNLTKLV